MWVSRLYATIVRLADLHYFESCIFSIADAIDTIVCMGDLNIDLFGPADYIACNICNPCIVSLFSFRQIITSPIRVMSASLDLIIISSETLDLMINYYLINYSLIGGAGVRYLQSLCSLRLSASCAVLPSGSHLSGILVLFAPLTSLPSLRRLIGTRCLKGVTSTRWFPYSHLSS